MPVQRTRPYRDELIRVGIRDLRESLGSRWRSANSVALTIGDTVTVVEILDLPCAQTFGGKKRWLLCACGRKAMALGHLEGMGWSCCKCGRWAGRDRGRLLRERQRGGVTPANHVSHEPVALPCGGEISD